MDYLHERETVIDKYRFINFIVYVCSWYFFQIVFWHRKEKHEVGRVRRDLQNGGTTDSKMPQFEKPLYVASVHEEQPAGTTVCTVHAKSVEGGEISYQMIPLLDSRSHSMFSINSESGVVTTSVSLDRFDLHTHTQFIYSYVTIYFHF